MRGFLVFLSVLWWFYWGLVSDLWDTVLVLWGVKWWPATGRARWIWDVPEPDERAGRWQRPKKKEMLR